MNSLDAILLLREPDKQLLERVRSAGFEVSQVVSAVRLRELGVVGAVRELRRVKCDRLVVVGDAAELDAYGAILSMASLFAGARSRVTFNLSDERVQSVSLPVSGMETLRMLGASLFGVAALFRQKKLIVRLMKSPLTAIPGGPVKRVLYLRPGVFNNYQVGGSVGHVAGVANAMSQLGLDVEMISVAPQVGVEEKVKQIRVLPFRSWALPLELNAIRYSFRYGKAAKKAARQLRPDVIYQRYTPNDLSGVSLAKEEKIPLIMEYNGSEVWIQRNWGRPMRFEGTALQSEKISVRNAELVVTVSEPLRQELLALGVEDKRAFFYPNCIDPKLFDPNRFTEGDILSHRKTFGLEPNDLVFTFVGTFGRWHGTEILARSIRSLIDAETEWLRRKRVRFLLIGAGAMSDFVNTLLGKNGDDEFVRLPGARPQLETPMSLAASDCLMSPHAPISDGSPFFGSPTKLFEYMAMQKPVILSDLDQLGQIARGWTPVEEAIGAAEDWAILARPGDINDLSEKIRLVVEMTAENRAERGRSGRDAVLREYTWDANVKAVLKRLHELR